MSETRKPFWIGLFLLGGALLLAVALLLLGRENWLRQHRDYVVYFTGALDGLDVGGDVTYRGVKVGQVHEVSLQWDSVTQDVVMPVVLRITPQVHLSTGSAGMDRVVEQLIERGLRAQLQTPSLLTGKAIVALDLFPGKPGYSRSRDEDDLPVIPSVPSRADQAARVLNDLVGTLGEMPLREIVESLRVSLAGIERLVGSPETQQGLQHLGATLGHLDSLSAKLDQQLPVLLASGEQSSKALQLGLQELRNTTRASQRTLEDISRLSRELQQSLGPQSEAQYRLLRSLDELARASKAMQRTLEGIDQQPQSLIFGKE